MSTTINEKLETIIGIIDQMDEKLERLERLIGSQENAFEYPEDNISQPGGETGYHPDAIQRLEDVVPLQNAEHGFVVVQLDHAKGAIVPAIYNRVID